MIDQISVPDADQRRLALDPTQSFIVQAPAGSGKTALLIQRYLKLLACVDSPEEIVAITFTRKAAAEMRTRVLAALQMESSKQTANNAYEKINYQLAQAVLQRDRLLEWHIIENPDRLRIQTIDSFCAALTRQMPVLSQFGAQPEIIDDASNFYREAARATLCLLNHRKAIADDVERLLEHLDNDAARAEELLAEMLVRRDHWLRHLQRRPRDELEAALQNSRQYTLHKVSQLFPAALENELLILLRYAADNLVADNKISDIACCASVTSLATASVEHWRGIAELLLTGAGAWRKQVNVAIGFPPGNTKVEKELAGARKNQLKVLIDTFASQDDLRIALLDVHQLPPPNYTDQQWEILGSITRLLPYAVAQLQIIFQTNGLVDFSEVAQRALQALGDSEMPTDLALALDYRIKHLMIDEFQDTSISQFRLLEKLTAGWTTGDGRTLFIVGDPMQSIYRFREAEVGLFLQAKHQGIGDLTLQSLTLRTNFRSQQGIIDWVNVAFKQIMPQQEDNTTGAVAYTPSIALHPKLDDEAVTFHPFYAKDFVAEAQRVVEIIQQTRSKDASGTIAILVRNRSHLSEIVAQLKVAGLRFRAIEIELLRYKPVVQDLLVLTRALSNPADRLAWVALLRAPWCGFLLKDITALLQSDVGVVRKKTIWGLMSDEKYWSGISPDAQSRLSRINPILKLCMENQRRQSLRLTVEAAWQALGGVHSSDAGNFTDAMIYLDYLESKETAGSICDLTNFEQGLNALYASHEQNEENALQIMTIHKAKGLEFDTVILPGLGRVPRKSEKHLLKWIEQPRGEVAKHASTVIADLMLAPIKAADDDVDAIYSWLEKLDQDKERLESDRLLYVAATRAKSRLHMLGHVDMSSDTEGKIEPKEPRRGSLLQRLWPIARNCFNDIGDECRVKGIDVLETADNPLGNQLYRLNSNWVLPDPPYSISSAASSSVKKYEEEIEFSWVSDIARHIGIVVHRWLQKISEDEMRGWNSGRIQALQDQFKQNLRMTGMIEGDEEIENAARRISRVLINAISDRRGQWILGPQKDAKNELRITSVIDNQLRDSVIDRTFCDEKGVRWIIDYKTSSHEGADLEEFLDREQIRYQHQLNQYAKLMREIDHRPIKLGLYFPLIGGWREW